MIYPLRKFVAVLLALWLPLFSGNALAATIVMQSMGGGCHAAQSGASAMQSGAHHTHQASMHQHMQHAGHLAQQSHPHDKPYGQHHPSHKDCAVCQLACCGYLAAVTVAVPEIQPAAQPYTPAAAPFQSVSLVPLVPPPLARV